MALVVNTFNGAHFELNHTENCYFRFTYNSPEFEVFHMKIELAIFQMSVLVFSCLANSANEVYRMCKREANEITTLTSGRNVHKTIFVLYRAPNEYEIFTNTLLNTHTHTHTLSHTSQ